MKRQCRAKSKRSGKRCKRAPILGGGVCHFHGGSSPQAQRAASVRLAALVDPAITALGELVKGKRPPGVRLGAVKDILDRGGFGAPKQFEIGGGGVKHEVFTEPDTDSLGAEDAARLKQLLGNFEAGKLLTRAQQMELHSLKSKAGQKGFHRISNTAGPPLMILIPHNNRS